MVEKAGMTDCQVEKPFPHKKFVEICSQAESWRAEACRRAECSFVNLWGFPGCARGKEPACQCTRHKRCWFDLWVRKIPWRRKWLPTPVFLPGEFHGLWGLARVTKLSTTEQLTLSLFSPHIPYAPASLDLASSTSYHHPSLSSVSEFSHPSQAAQSTSQPPFTWPVLMSGASWGLDHN